MQIDPIPLHNQVNLMKDYRNYDKNILQFFDYHPFHDLRNRVRDIQKRCFPREELSNLLLQMNREWDAPLSTLHNIERLKMEESVVVIGGQQAGLLTGPMYTINKIISIVQFAKQQEETLNIPVIPVFWIAGEDHDFAEINHVYLPKEGKMKKFKVPSHLVNKQSVSDMEMDKAVIEQWILELFQTMEETNYTKKLYHRIHSCLENSNTFTDFFAGLLFWLFDKEGLVLIDSHDSRLRQLESPYFIRMIERQSVINNSVHESIKLLRDKGYSVDLDLDEHCGHLFYHLNKERVLLNRDSSGYWVGKQNEVYISTDELIEVAKNNPQLLSNNVITRPLMQECLFPSLAFIGGPGEISYWATLKEAFHIMDMTMPAVVPRLSFSYIDRNVAKALKEFNLEVSFVIENGVEEFRNRWLQSKVNPPISEIVAELKRTVQKGHEPLRNIAKDVRSDVYALAEKNLLYLYREIDFLEKRIVRALEEKYEKEWEQLELIHISLHPNNGLQERIWNPLPWMNKYGKEFIQMVSEQAISFEEDHYIVFL